MVLLETKFILNGKTYKLEEVNGLISVICNDVNFFWLDKTCTAYAKIVSAQKIVKAAFNTDYIETEEHDKAVRQVFDLILAF